MQSIVTVNETSPISALAAHVAIAATGIALAALLSLHDEWTGGPPAGGWSVR